MTDSGRPVPVPRPRRLNGMARRTSVSAVPASPPSPSRPVGTVTRGTTNPNRLRRMDRWIAAEHGAELRRAGDPVAVDLGYGAAPWTAVELLAGCARCARTPGSSASRSNRPGWRPPGPYSDRGWSSVHGGFEVPLPGGPGRAPVLIRAANVLRQYDEDAGGRRMAAAVRAAGSGRAAGRGHLRRDRAAARLGGPGSRRAPHGHLRDPARLPADRPSDLAERLPKALIHRNVPGEPVHAFLRDFDRAWAAAAPLGALGARQRWLAAVRSLAADWPLAGDPRRRRQGEVTVRWEALAPRR